MGCCFLGTESIENARIACKDALFEAVTSQLVSSSASPTLIDAIPTIGKTSAAAQFAAELCEGERDTRLTYLTHRTANREQFEEMVREFVEDDSVVDAVHLPVLEEDCPSARGEHGEGWQSRLLKLRDQGLSPSSLHRNQQLSLPCGGTDCPYMDWWTREGETDLLIGHLSHAYIPEVIDDRVVIIDEDPEDSFQYRFSASDLHRLVGEFLGKYDDVPISDLDSLKLLRQNDSAFDDARETVLDRAKDVDQFELGQEILQDGQGHVYAALLVRTLLESETEEPAEADTYRVTLDNGVEHVRLGESTVGAYDPESGELAIRQTPDFTRAAALVGLDGTPTTELWRGRLGVEDLEHVQVLCDECRQDYLSDVLGYRFIQTTPYIKPYSGGQAKRLSIEKDRGLLHEVSRKARSAVGLITTKAAKEKLLNHDDGNDVSIPTDRIGHYRNIKGSNEFEGDDVRVGVVVGSPHPGPDELRLLAGLNGDSFDTNLVEKTRDGHHYSRREPTPEAEPYLEHVREHSVAQAALRFGRQDGATVIIHTAALPSWMQAVCQQGRITPRSDGERSVIRVLGQGEELTTSEIAERTNFSSDTVRDHLKQLDEQNIISRGGSSHRLVWEVKEEIDHVSPTANVEFPDGVFA